MSFDRVDALCDVDAVTVDAGDVTTTLTCDVDGTPTPASLRFAVAPEGAVDWEAGQEVHLLADRTAEFGDMRLVQLRTAMDDGLLAVAVWGGEDGPKVTDAFAPLTYGFTKVCSAVDNVEVVQLDFKDPGGGELHLLPGDRGSLPIDAEHVFAVDITRAEIGASAHFNLWQNVVLRRVRVGG